MKLSSINIPINRVGPESIELGFQTIQDMYLYSYSSYIGTSPYKLEDLQNSVCLN